MTFTDWRETLAGGAASAILTEGINGGQLGISHQEQQ